MISYMLQKDPENFGFQLFMIYTNLPNLFISLH